MPTKKDIIAICIPSTPEVERWKNWANLFHPKYSIKNTLIDALADENIRALVLIGFSDVSNIFDITDNKVRSRLFGRCIYHIGDSHIESVKNLIEAGLSSYIGYSQKAATSIINDKFEKIFQDGFLHVPRMFSKGISAGESFDNSYLGWEKAISQLLTKNNIKNSNISDIKLAVYLLSINHQNMFFVGDRNWHMSSKVEFIIITVPPPPSLPPRFEVVNISDSILTWQSQSKNIQVIDSTSSISKWIREDFERIHQLSAGEFEDLISNLLKAMGHEVIKVSSTYSRDGGIDLIAIPKNLNQVPYLLAVQVKHSQKGSIGPSAIRDFRGVLDYLPFDIGMVVTNSTFTPDAKWVAKQSHKIVRLRDFENLRLWLQGQFSGERDQSDLPDKIEVAPGLIVNIPRILR